ncbi:MAG: Gfo/Idh/MocA family oxidoreductase [Spirochaetia bacterium]|jgi:predicted dehydrogenase|nr:Gfo/Idh/MocA family oxidoreductase [Spirochaetia bacterium]
MLKYAMIGGGEGAFIGDVHRRAIRFDGRAALVAGSFSRDAVNNKKTGESLFLDPSRVYSSYEELLEKEKEIDFITIVTPNNLHYPIAKKCLEHGINVVCEKPVTVTLEDALELKKLSEKNCCHFAVTYTYTGYPMVKEMKALIDDGKLGKLRFVKADCPEAWMAEKVEEMGNRQAQWRSDPAQTGKTNCLGDIGVHIENLVSYVTGLKIKKVCAVLDSFVEGRALDDNAVVMLEYEDGAKGLYWLSYIAIGHGNGMKIEIYGSKGSLIWVQERPNELIFSPLNEPSRILKRGAVYLSALQKENTCLPEGHPEGYYEALANIYNSFIDELLTKNSPVNNGKYKFPTLKDGVESLLFVKRSLESAESNSSWVEI